MSARRVPVDEVMRVITLFETDYFDFTVKHFHEKLVEKGYSRSYTWLKNTLQEAGVVKKAKKRGRHRHKRARKPLPGMMLHQDGSKHEWVPGKYWDLMVTMDDATSEIYCPTLGGLKPPAVLMWPLVNTQPNLSAFKSGRGSVREWANI
jgi:hypothetical protein